MKALLVAAALALVAPAANAAEAIVNGGFETGVISPWFNDRDFSGGGTPWFATTDDAHTGRWSATDIGNIEIRQNFAAIDTDSITGASFWLKHPSGSGLPAFVSFFYADVTDTGFTVSTLGTDWEFFDVLNQIESGKTLIGFSVFGYSGGAQPNVTLLDDVSITFDGAVVPEPATWALMIAGFGMVGASLRRRRVAVA